MHNYLSDTATRMFLERGFDQVRVTEIAVACGVSEKTVYNYFPTKESLVLDREGHIADDIRRAIAASTGSLPAAVVAVLADDLDRRGALLGPCPGGTAATSPVTQFATMVETTPSLRAAHRDMMDRLLQVAADALGARFRTDSDAPEQQIAATALLGLWRVQFRALRRYADGVRTAAEVRDAVLDEVTRAAHVVEDGLRDYPAAPGRRPTVPAAARVRRA